MLEVIEAYIAGILDQQGYRPWDKPWVSDQSMTYHFSSIKSDVVRYCLIKGHHAVSINCWIWASGNISIRGMESTISYEKKLDVHDPEFADQLLTFIRNAPIAVETRSSLKSP